MRLTQARRLEGRHHAETLTCWRSTCLVRKTSGCVILETGNDLVEVMREAVKLDIGHPRPDFFKVGIYSGFVIGAFDAYILAGLLCPPDRATHGQAMAIVSRYLEANPDEWNLPAAYLAREALLFAFPCPK
jgi:Rap1a immunity proteins